MYSEGLATLIIKVISSWQVIFITIALILFVSVVSYAAKSYHAPRHSSGKKLSFKKKKADANTVVASKEETGKGENSNDELGLEEA